MKFREQDPNSDFITPFRDVNKMTYAELLQAYDEVCEDRRDLEKSVLRYQNNIWSKEDTEQLERMNEWAMIVFTALRH